MLNKIQFNDFDINSFDDSDQVMVKEHEMELGAWLLTRLGRWVPHTAPTSCVAPEVVVVRLKHSRHRGDVSAASRWASQVSQPVTGHRYGQLVL